MKANSAFFRVLAVGHHRDDLAIFLPNTDGTALAQIASVGIESGMDHPVAKQQWARLGRQSWLEACFGIFA